MNSDSQNETQNELKNANTSSNSNTNQSWKKGWIDSETNKTGTGWGVSWGSSSTKDSASNNSWADLSAAASKKGSGWGKGWGDSSKSDFNFTRPTNGWGKGWGDPSNKELSATRQTNGWGKGWASSKDTSTNEEGNFSGSGWGKNISSIENPFSKKDENADSSDQKNNGQRRNLYEAFNVKPPRPRITFNFGTDKEFQSTNDPNIPFEECGIKISSFTMPKPPPQNQKAEVDDSEGPTLPTVDEKTGEEGEEVLFNEKAKALAIRPSDDDEKKLSYVEIGIGELHFNHSENDNCYRMTMRRDQQNIVLNTRIFKDMKPKLIKKGIQFLGQGAGKNVDKYEIYTFRFENDEKAKRLYDLIVDTISKL